MSPTCPPEFKDTADQDLCTTTRVQPKVGWRSDEGQTNSVHRDDDLRTVDFYTSKTNSPSFTESQQCTLIIPTHSRAPEETLWKGRNQTMSSIPIYLKYN